MANHGYVTTRRFLTPKMVDDALRAHSTTHFGPRLDVIGPHTDWPGMRAAWELEFIDLSGNAYGYPLAFQIHLTTRRKLEFRHPIRSRFAFWAQCLLQELLAIDFDGTLRDDGVEGSWPPSHGNLVTYSRWLNQMYSHLVGPVRHLLKRFDHSGVPDDLRTIPSYGELWGDGGDLAQ